MRNVSVGHIVELQNNPAFVRNVCILAHVDHGKTTLADSLVASNGVISQRLAGKLRYMDSRKDEQQRGITMKSSAISLGHSYLGQDYLVNLIDSPGHVDFSGEVSTAIRLCDGAIIVVDIIEGVCPQTKEALRQAWMEHIKPVLVLNKMDRLILERKLTPLDAYVHLQQILEQVNVVVGQLFTTDILEKSSKDSAEANEVEEKKPKEAVYEWSHALEDTDDSTVYFAPEQGNVVFASALDGWGFGVANFAKLYSTKLGMKEENLKKTLWGDYYLNTKNKHIMKGAQAKSKKPLFVQFILDNIWAVYEAVYTRRDKEMTEKIISSLNLKLLARDLRHSDARVQLQAVLGQWLPLSCSVLDMVCKITPSPDCLSEERAQSLICSNTHRFDCLPPETQRLKHDFLACSSEASAPVVVCVSKMFAVEQNQLPRFKQKLLTPEEIQCRREQARQKRANKVASVVLTNGDSEEKTEQGEPSSVLQNGCEGDLKFIAFARIFSGTIRKGQQLYVLGPKHDPEKILGSESVTINPSITLKDLRSDEHITVVTVEDLYLLMGRELEELDAVPAGNVLGIGGLDEHVLKSATLSTTLACPPFVDLHANTAPILRVAIEPVRPSEMQNLVDGLKLLNQADPCVQVMIQETGEHVLVTAGEVHLQRCLDDLRDRFANIEISVSPPIVPCRETIILPPKLDMVNEFIEGSQRKCVKQINSEGETTVTSDGSVVVSTSNKKCRIVMRAIPLPEAVTDLLEKNSELLKVQDKAVLSTKSGKHASNLTKETIKALADLKKKLEEAFLAAGAKWKDVVNQIWAFGPRRCGCNLLLNRVQNYKRPSVWLGCEDSDNTLSSSSQTLSEYDASFVGGFQLATLSGPICEEPLMGVGFVVEEWELTSAHSKTTDVNSNSCNGLASIDLHQDCDLEAHSNNVGVPFGPLSGQIMSAVKEGCRKAFQAQPQRLMAAMYSCNIQVTSEVLGKMYAVLGRRHGRVLSGDLQEGSQTFNITAVLPVAESFDFPNEIRKQTSGMASPQLIFSHWEVVDVDPFWVPTTEEEYLHYGEKADSENQALKYMNAVRRRKGLAVDEKIVEHAEKQRTLTRKK